MNIVRDSATLDVRRSQLYSVARGDGASGKKGLGRIFPADCVHRRDACLLLKAEELSEYLDRGRSGHAISTEVILQLEAVERCREAV